MREMTYFRGKQSGFLDVRSSDSVLHLQAPDLVNLLSKRVKYIEGHLRDDHRYSTWNRRQDSKQFFSRAGAYANAIKTTLLAAVTGRATVELLAAIAWHDVRAFLLNLRILHRSLGSEGRWGGASVIGALLSTRTPSLPRALVPNLFEPPYPGYPCFCLKARIALRLLYTTAGESSRRGLELRQILRFTRLYGYHDRWTRRALQTMVRERLLECIEAPAAVDYTGRYEIAAEDSFRASPLAVVLVERLARDETYLALIGNDLPFHDDAVYRRYVESVRAVLSASSGNLLPPSVELLQELGVARTVAHHLQSSSAAEVPPGGIAIAFPEIAAVEARFRKLSDAWHALADADADAPSEEATVASTDDAADPRQLALPEFDDAQPVSRVNAPIPVPPNLVRARIGRSRLAALVLWAMVALRASRRDAVTGADITRILNELALDEHHRKAASNISKALRSPAMRAQRWLVASGVARRYRYSLTDGWKAAWLHAFGAPIPVVDRERRVQ